jgi:hypothetical protein
MHWTSIQSPTFGGESELNVRTLLVLLYLCGVLIFASACGMVNTLLSGRSSGTVNQLWADVPPLDGAAKADLEMPLAARLAVQAMLQGKMDFIAYTTNRTPAQVVEFYTLERMNQAGWNVADAAGCTADAGSDSTGGLCFFGKKSTDQNLGLAIIIAQDENSKQTQIFYARIDLTEKQSN